MLKSPETSTHSNKIIFGLFLIFNHTASFVCAESSIKKSESTQYEESFLFINIDKSQRSATIQTLPSPENPSHQATLHSFTVSFGKSQGDKQKEGDNKTPEGLYFARPHISGKNLLQSKYGPQAIPLNFPNPIDKFQKKTGHGIWLHGAGDDRRMDKIFVTEGCVAFYNKDMIEVSQFIKPYQTLVSISKTASTVNTQKSIAALHQKTLSWLHAWRTRDLESYFSFYHPDFNGKGKNLKKYKVYKSRVFRSYKKIALNIEDLHIITHEKYAMSIMNQDFRGDQRFTSEGRKVLYWLKTNGVWQIIRESFNHRRFIPTRLETSI